MFLVIFILKYTEYREVNKMSRKSKEPGFSQDSNLIEN